MYSVSIQKRIGKNGNIQFHINLPIEIAKKMKLDKRKKLHLDNANFDEKKVLIVATSKKKLREYV